MPTPWPTRIWQEYRAGNISRAGRDVLLTLHTFRGTGGHCWPSHATIADRARCCVRTVQRALATAQALGLVSWAERRVRAGWRWLRSSNRYWFTVPDQPISSETADLPNYPKVGSRQTCQNPTNPPVSTTGHDGRGGESQRKKEALTTLLREAAAAPDLLLARRLAWAQRNAAVAAKAW